MRLVIRSDSELAKAFKPKFSKQVTDAQTSLFGSSPIINNPNLKKEKRVNKKGQLVTKYVRRDVQQGSLFGDDAKAHHDRVKATQTPLEFVNTLKRAAKEHAKGDSDHFDFWKHLATRVKVEEATGEKTVEPQDTQSESAAIKPKPQPITETKTGNTRIPVTAADIHKARELRKRRQLTIHDRYQEMNAPRELKGVDNWGNEKFGYAYSPDLFLVSDASGMPIRHYVKLESGAVVHPDELGRIEFDKSGKPVLESKERISVLFPTGKKQSYSGLESALWGVSNSVEYPRKMNDDGNPIIKKLRSGKTYSPADKSGNVTLSTKDGTTYTMSGSAWSEIYTNKLMDQQEFGKISTQTLAQFLEIRGLDTKADLSPVAESAPEQKNEPEPPQPTEPEEPRDKDAVSLQRALKRMDDDKAMRQLVAYTKGDEERLGEIIYLTSTYMEEDGEGNASDITDRLEAAYERQKSPAGDHYKDDALSSYESAGGRTRDKVDPDTQYIYASPSRPLDTIWASKIRPLVVDKKAEVVDSPNGRTKTSAHSYIFSDKPLEPGIIEGYELKPVATPSKQVLKNEAEDTHATITQEDGKHKVELHDSGEKVEGSSKEFDSKEEAEAHAHKMLHGDGPKVGDTKTENGVTYQLNENSRWERVSEDTPEPEGYQADYKKLIMDYLNVTGTPTTVEDVSLSLPQWQKFRNEHLGNALKWKQEQDVKVTEPYFHELKRIRSGDLKPGDTKTEEDGSTHRLREDNMWERVSEPAPKPPKQDEVTRPIPQDLPIDISHDDVPYQLAYDAHRNSSFSPEKRAKQRQQEYVDTISQLHETLKKYAKTPEQEAVLKDELQMGF